MRQLVYEIASTYKTHKFAENFKELGIYSCFRMSRNCRRLGSSLASRCLEIVDSDLVLLHNVLKFSTRQCLQIVDDLQLLIHYHEAQLWRFCQDHFVHCKLYVFDDVDP
jgi:hypothetical protein